jgi:ubiquinone/menaquinone biosynthesis C-methylase UbiE
MEKLDNIKSVVREKYAEIARKSNDNCGCGCCGQSQNDFIILQDEYNEVEGYVADADLRLGCGLPTQFADIQVGDTVLDLGSGAGNDVFVARSLVGENGHVIGLDMTEEMIDKAVQNNKKMGYKNVEFRLGDIENMPLESHSVDVIVSNCVLNLVPEKKRAFNEIYRVLKPGGHFCVSDIVTKGELPEQIKHSAELYVGCVSGALKKEDYLKIIENTSFKKVQIHASKDILIPDELLKEILNDEYYSLVKDNDIGIISLTVSGYK